MSYFVIGINGSGKTTMLKAVSKTTGIEIVQGTHILMENLGIPGDYNALSSLDQSYILAEWGKTAALIIFSSITQ